LTRCKVLPRNHSDSEKAVGGTAFSWPIGGKNGRPEKKIQTNIHTRVA
jgi:hypothetical protein